MTRPTKRKYTQYAPESDLLEYEFHYNDDETAALHKKINKNPKVDKDDLRRIALWKINRVMNVSDETLNKLRSLAILKGLTIEHDLAKEVIEDLVSSEGIGFPMASAILKFIRPDVFPIIDIRAYRAFTGKKPYYSTYTFEKYKEYATALKTDANSKNRSLKVMDEQLYCFDQENNGKI